VSDSFSELFITQNEPEIETLNQSAQDECNDSITVAKTVANSDALETIKNSDSDVLNSSNITGQGQTVVDNPKGQKGKKGRKSNKKSSTDTNITLCICNDSQMVSDMIRCNFCQIWFHTRCITAVRFRVVSSLLPTQCLAGVYSQLPVDCFELPF
jgi:hypothetical protein